MTPELQDELRSLTDRLDRAEQDARAARRRARLSACLAACAVGLTLLLNARPPARAQTPGVSLAGLINSISALTARLSTDETSIAKLQAKTAPLSVSNDPYAGGTNTLLTISGVNVQIVDGNKYGTTSDGTFDPATGLPTGAGALTGLGNLILGYNAPSARFRQARTGSHNLVLGDGNNYLSFGGLTAGVNTLTAGPYASVIGGNGNAATGPFATVSGGGGNTASGPSAAVSGGQRNTAGPFSTASGVYATVSGGFNNTAAGLCATVSGGNGNNAGGDQSTIGGGFQALIDNLPATQDEWTAGVNGGARDLLSPYTGVFYAHH